MEKEELEGLIGAAIGEAIAPIVGAIGQMRKEANEMKQAQEEKKEGELSPSVQNWINDKATGGLGGKSLDAPTPHNPKPKTVDPGPTHLDGKLTGKTV